MARVLGCLVLFLSVSGSFAGQGTYFLSSPKDIILGSMYSISVDILNGSRVDVTAQLKESLYNGKTNRYEDNILKNISATFMKGLNGKLGIPIEDDFKCSRCQLTVKGRGSQVFERTVGVNVRSKVVSIFIQTDKAIYKPGQRVRYRAFAVYPNLQIYRGSFSVKIKDPSGHKLVSEKERQSKSGVVEGFLNLSDQPPFGDWTIKVAAEDLPDSESQSFTVAQYELPRFEVTVDIPSFALLADTRLSGTIKAKYTYGKPVKGLVELYVGPDGLDQCGRMPKSVNLALEIDGEVRFSVPKSSINRVMRLNENTVVRVTAIVKESATGVKLNGSQTIQYHSNEFTVSFMSNTPSVFKPGLPYTAYVQVKSPDGLPPPVDADNLIVVYPYVSYMVKVGNQEKYGIPEFTGTYALPNTTVPLTANGIVPINIDIPNNATQINMQIHYKKLSTSKQVDKAYSPSNNYMQLSLKDNNVKSGDVATFQLQGTEGLETIHYEIVARGNIQKSGSLVANGQSTFSFELPLTSFMAPVANLLTYYIRSNAEIVADSISFNVDGIFENKVTVDFTSKKIEPNKNVQVRVTADSESDVFLLAVDQSVLLLKSGNDIDINKVENGISSQKPIDSEFALSHSASDFRDVFRKSGLNYITDIEIPVRPFLGRPRSSYSNRAHSYPSPLAYDAMPPPSMTSLEASSLPTLKKVDRIRNKFPEAWLWTDTKILKNGPAYINTTVPDTITSWVASAFATNRKSGLGVAAAKANLTVFKSFFLSLTYPSIIKRNEKAVVQATVFNYLPSTTEVVVSMKPSEGFQHVLVFSNGTEKILQDAYPQRLLVESNSEGVVFFPILAKEIGVFDIELTARSPLAADGVRRHMSIEAEGAPVTSNIQVYIEQDGNSVSFENSYPFTFPKTTVPGSQTISVGVSGDLIGPSLDNIDNLLSIPLGCGEQNMVKFVPNLYIAKYLQATGQLSKVKRQDMVDVLFAGYQRQLSYVRSDGSFSAFGNNDQSGSTWLTAQVTRTLSEARQFIYVDPQLLISAIDWLVNRQRDDGQFTELGRVIDPNTQGKNSGPALTAFCAISLLQNRDLISEEKCQKFNKNCYRTERWINGTRKAITHLEESLENIEDPFPLSVVSYALNLAKSPKAMTAFNKLKGKMNSEGGLTYLISKSKPKSTPAPMYLRIWDPINGQSRSTSILSTSYALLSFTAIGQIQQAIPMVKWLVSQRNSFGGFSSTQDTTVALQALSAYATKSIHPRTKLNMNFEVNSAENLGFSLNKDNLLNFQRKEFTKTTFEEDKQYSLDVSAVGNGLAIAEINFNYHTSEVEPSKAFDVSTVLLDDGLDNFNLMICTKWLKEGKTGMVVQEIEIPSGFQPDLTTIGNVADMKQYEQKGNVAAIYFDEIGKTSTCYSILMTRKSKVAHSEKSFVRTFNYYQPEDESTVFYQPIKLRDSTVCDVCPRCCR